MSILFGARRIALACAALALLLPGLAGAQQQSANLPSPESYFGFKMGADRKLARWDKLVEYYQELASRSPRMTLVNMGNSTLGNPFLVLYISAPENLAKLEEYRQINTLLMDPRGASEAQVNDAIANGKAVVVQSMGLHSSEVAASQMAAELVHDMLTRNDDEMMNILANTIAIMIPCLNPDGEIMVTDWYNETVGTEYEGLGLPQLYHHYIGHDNNRDAYMQNTIESVYGAKILFQDWTPQAYIDHHQMGPFGARLYVPPYSNPTRPEADPLVWREMSWYGAHIAYKEEEAGKSGVVNAAIYSGWGHFGFHWITPFHNTAGMLTESASARLATPLYLHPDQLRGGARALPEYEEQTTFPNPWPGGWWRVRDIVEQQKISAIAALDIAARNRETVLTNAVLKARRQTTRGAAAEVKAYIIPAQQHDALTADKLVNVLLDQGVEVKEATQEFVHQGRVYGPGTRVVSRAQPKQGLIRWLLGRTFYPDNSYTRNRDGTPIRPYDMSTDNVAEYMGVAVDEVGSDVTVALQPVRQKQQRKGRVQESSNSLVLDGRLNESFRAVNMLWDAKINLRRNNRGDFIVPSGADAEILQKIAADTGVNFSAAQSGDTAEVKRQRIGLYQRYYGGNMDEGWTRLLLEQFGFPYTTLMDPELKKGNLKRKYDVIILPNDNMERMIGENDEDRRQPYPEKYRSGMGDDGVKALEAFVKAGGRLLTFGEAGELPIEKFNLPIRNVVERVPSTDFWSPGSTLRMRFDHSDPLAYGMPDKGVGLFLQGNLVFQVVPSEINHRIRRIAVYEDRDILQSGWLLGEEHIAKKAAMVQVDHGKGDVVMIGFRPQHRAQTHGTYKLVFNALVNAPPAE